MNELSLLMSFVTNHFINDNLVNTVTMVETKHIDNNKENIYQLVNIDYLQSDEIVSQDNGSSGITARYLITAVQQRNIYPKKIDSKLRLDSNLIDNWNETHATLQRFLNVFKSNNYENNIDLYSQTSMTKLEDWNKNGLDGHQITIELSIPNLGSGC